MRDDLIESPRYMWQMAALIFGIGATIGVISLLVPHPATFDDSALWANIAFSYVGAAFCLIAAGRLPVRLIHPVAVIGILAITRASYYSGEPSGFYSLFYVWIGFYVVFFFSRPVATAYLVTIGAAYAWLLHELGASAALARWVLTVGTVAFGAYLIGLLVSRVRRSARNSAALAHEREELMATLAEVARTDELTGLPNRRAWDESLARELARAKRDSTPLCVGLVDLDLFKEFNDDHGHQAGDRLLKQLAGAWGAQLRASDFLARYGGEEFALALPGCDLHDAGALLERLRAATPADQTCSAGLVLWDGAESGECIVGRADKALYEAKDTGRDRIVTE